MSDHELREALWLVKNGIPFEVAFKVDDSKRAAMSIIFTEFEGGKFNWNSMEFEEPS